MNQGIQNSYPCNRAKSIPIQIGKGHKQERNDVIFYLRSRTHSYAKKNMEYTRLYVYII